MEKLEDHMTGKKQRSATTDLQSSLKKEILHLERRLQDQFTVRQALENALGYRSSTLYTSTGNSMPKPTKELIKEIAVLELEVMYLEQYLLSLYREAYNQQNSDLSPSVADERLRSLKEVSEIDSTSKQELPQEPIGKSKKENNDIRRPENITDPGAQCRHATLSHHSVCITGTSPPKENLDKILRSCHSQPLSFLKYTDYNTTNIISLAEHFGARISDHIPETPNRLSENVIRSMATIYFKLAHPPLRHHGLSSSPTSSLSSTSAFSPQDHGDMWSPYCNKETSIDAHLENPFPAESLREFSGPYSTMVEVSGICREGQRLNDVEDMLQNYMSLVQRLEKVDPRMLKHEEKIAFWINVHNALVMHAYLVYGVPQNTIKRGWLFLKAAYNVGGQTVSADMIQNSILGCRTVRPGQWLQAFLSPKMKLKGDARQSYAIEHSEPLLCFALCTGSHSDPAVRIYKAKRVTQELEAAKEEYIKATISIHREQKILLPKLIESFAKNLSLNSSSASVMELVQHYLPINLQEAMQRQKQRPPMQIEWVPHNFAFRYLLSKEVAK